MAHWGRITAIALAAGVLYAGAAPAASPRPPVAPSATGTTLRNAIKYVVVIYQENWSFDGLYGKFPGANGLSNAGPARYAQVDKSGAPLAALPQPLGPDNKPDPAFPKTLPVEPYDLARFKKPSDHTGDLVHRFYQQQTQIDGGKMDQFAAWSDNPGLVLSYFDATDMPEGKLAAQYTLADNFFHSAFGGSFLNHQWLVCACTPVFPSAPPSAVAALDPNGKLALDASGKIVRDGSVTPDGFVVNTAFTVNKPHPDDTRPEMLVPNQTNATIGDRLSAARVGWKWYSGGWNDALAGHADKDLFQFHHQPLAYYKSFADGTRAKADHLQDEVNFLADLHANRLPAVSFVKPFGPDNEHPRYADLARGQAHVAKLVSEIQHSPYWKNVAILITYDENGGRWDHVAPPAASDRWGPGARVPLLVVSPWAKRHFIDHTQYETVSILAFIERAYGLQPLATRDAAANPLANAFVFSQTSPR